MNATTKAICGTHVSRAIDDMVTKGRAYHHPGHGTATFQGGEIVLHQNGKERHMPVDQFAKKFSAVGWRRLANHA